MKLWAALALAACSRGHGSNGAPIATITVTARWTGHAPADAMTEVAAPIEGVIAAEAGLEHVATTCRDGTCVVTAVLADGADADAFARGVREGLEPILRRLPDDLDGPPMVERRTRGAVMRVNVFAPGNDAVATRRAVDALVHRIEMAAGVSGIETCGGATERIAVAIDPMQLASYGLGAAEVADALAHATANVPAGNIDAGRQDYTLAVAGGRSSDEIAETVVTIANGASVRLRDVATIAHDTVATPCARRVADDRAVIDVHVPDGDDAQRPIADAIRAAAREARVEVEIVHGPARYVIAMRGPADGVAARTLAAQWRSALAATVEVEPGPSRTGVWTIDRDAAARAGVSERAASLAVDLMTGHRRVSTLVTQGDEIPIELGSSDPDPEHVLVVGGEHPVHVSDIARRTDVDDRADRFDRQPAAIIRFAVTERGHADDVAADALAAARAAAPPPAGVTITTWREP